MSVLNVTLEDVYDEFSKCFEGKSTNEKAFKTHTLSSMSITGGLDGAAVPPAKVQMVLKQTDEVFIRLGVSIVL